MSAGRAGPTSPDSTTLRFDAHPRTYRDNVYVYAVLSRRAKGISVGINLNPDKICNFDCIYCQVDRTVPASVKRVDDERLTAELGEVLRQAAEGPLARLASLDGVLPEYRRLADVAFSGDGEPTSHPRFAELVGRVGDLIDEHVPGLPMTLLTNATLFHRPKVQEGLAELAARGGVVWAKLDAGTEEHYRLADASRIPFTRILDNILEEARRRPLVIQSLFFRVAGDGPPASEIDAYAQRLVEIVDRGGGLSTVQLTTVARKPPRPDVTALERAELEAIGDVLRERLPGVPVEIFPAKPPSEAASAPGDRDDRE